MEPLAMLQSDPLDILFENRNKSYGAYPLRKYYPQRLMISMGFTFSLVMLSSIAYLIFHSSPLLTREFIIPDTKIDPVVFPPKEKIILPPSKPFIPKPPASVQYTTLKIVPDQKVPEPMSTVENLQVAAIGLKTTPGEPDNGELHNNSNAGPGSVTQPAENGENNHEILDRAEVMPEFPGGIEALKRFLLKNLRMPEVELESGTRVQVIARFVVGSDGRVRDIEITRPAENVFNLEVKRVISKMPDWKPGSQNHRNVAVYFSLPVNFVSAD